MIRIIRDLAQAADADALDREVGATAPIELPPGCTEREHPPRPNGTVTRDAWKILVVDDEPDVRALTRATLRHMSFAGRTLEFIEAGSAAQAIERLQEHEDIAVALIDVVMESEYAGLKLVDTIRGPMANASIRLIIRTGQPGSAPARFVIDQYDIDDYKDKTELTSTRLYTTIRSALKAYRDLSAIEINRRGLERVLEAVPAIYDIGAGSLGAFFSGVLTQIIGLCQLTEASHIGTFEGLITTFDEGQPRIHAAASDFADNPRFQVIHEECLHAVLDGRTTTLLRHGAEILPLHVAGRPVGYIYVEPIEALTDGDRRLLLIMVRQCSQALENFELHARVNRDRDALVAETTAANTRLKQAQEQLLQSEKLASIGLLAAGVAHEINNPIGYVNSNLGTLRRYVDDLLAVIAAYESATGDGAPAPNGLAEVAALKESLGLDYLKKDALMLLTESREGLERVKKIIQSLKDFSHVEAIENWQVDDIRQGMESTLGVVWNELKYRCELRKDYGDIPPIECVLPDLNQVFMNLLVNAAHAIEDHGVVSIRTGRQGDAVWIEISDTGTGIPPEVLPHIFDPFFTTKPVGKGTGLGLAVSYGIVGKHHGRIEVDSEVGRGSTFRVWLPIRQPVAVQ